MNSGWKRGKSTNEWYENTKEFLDFVFSAQANVVQNGKIKCPCADCSYYIRKDRDAVELNTCCFDVQHFSYSPLDRKSVV